MSNGYLNKASGGSRSTASRMVTPQRGSQGLPTPSQHARIMAEQWGIKAPIPKNTFMDPNTTVETFRNAGGLSGGDWWKKLKGMSGGPSTGPQDVGVGSNMEMPQLGDWRSLTSSDIKQLYTPQVLSGQDIAREMNESPWAKMALEKQSAEQNQLYNQAAAQAAASNAQAQASLAARGGLRGGAAERLAGASGDNLAMARQNVLSQGAIERGKIGMENADRAMDLGRFNMGQRAAAEQGNIAAALQDNAAQNEQNRLKYTEGMKMKGAGMTADAIARGGGKK